MEYYRIRRTRDEKSKAMKMRDSYRRRYIRDEYYDYRKAVKDDIINFLEENEDRIKDMTKDEIIEFVNDEGWTDDYVTGNESGSYTFNREKAKEYVLANFDLLRESADEFDSKNQYADWLFGENWEALNVSIRCYLLGQEAEEAVDEYLRDKK